MSYDRFFRDQERKRKSETEKREKEEARWQRDAEARSKEIAARIRRQHPTLFREVPRVLKAWAKTGFKGKRVFFPRVHEDTPECSEGYATFCWTVLSPDSTWYHNLIVKLYFAGDSGVYHPTGFNMGPWGCEPTLDALMATMTEVDLKYADRSR